MNGPHPTHPAALSQSDLSVLTGYEQQAAIEAELHRLGIRFFRGRRGLWTTLDACNRALGIAASGEAIPQKLEF